MNMEKKKHIIRLNEAELESLVEEGVKRVINEGSYGFSGFANLPAAYDYIRKYIKSKEKEIIKGYVDTGEDINDIGRVLFVVTSFLRVRADEAREPEKEDKPNIFTKLRDKFDEKFGPKIGE
jgi:hypothetical protein